MRTRRQTDVNGNILKIAASVLKKWVACLIDSLTKDLITAYRFLVLMIFNIITKDIFLWAFNINNYINFSKGPNFLLPKNKSIIFVECR